MPSWFLLSVLICSFCGSVFSTVSEPVLLWSYVGPCYYSWCETGWYSSPLITTINGQGAVVGGGYTLFAVTGENGSTIWKNAFGGGRIWPGIIEADVNADGTNEIVIGNSDPTVAVLNKATGIPVWNQTRPNPGEIRAVAVANLDSTPQLELVVGCAYSSPINTWVYDHQGNIMPGWPQAVNATVSGYSAGIYNDNYGFGDLDGDGYWEIIAPSDVFYVCAYHVDGTPVRLNAGYWDTATVWGQAGFTTNIEDEIIGYTDCSTEPAATRTDFDYGVASSGDLDGDGNWEFVFTGESYAFCSGVETDEFTGVYVTQANRTRYRNPAKGYDWLTSVPNPTNSPQLGAPLSTDYNVIQNSLPNSVLADLDGNGELEIIFSSYDGKVHAFWLDQTEKYSWPYAVTTGSAYEYSSEPVVVDFDNDGFAEVVFGTWPENTAGTWGSLTILNYQGVLLYRITLPVSKACAFSSSSCSNTNNGILGAVSVGNINSDPNMEIVGMTINSGLIAFTVPNSTNARLLWPTGRSNYHRDGTTSNGGQTVYTTQFQATTMHTTFSQSQHSQATKFVVHIGLISVVLVLLGLLK